MKARNTALNFLVLSSCSLLITATTYLVNIWLVAGNEQFSPVDLLFIEGTMCFVVGFLLLLGRGGIGQASRKAAILSALTGAIFDENNIGPNEIYRRDTWKPKGFVRFALILIIAGIFMLIAYFLNFA